MSGLYSQCQECMGPLPPEAIGRPAGDREAIEDDDPFCSLECEQIHGAAEPIAEEEYLYGYPGSNEGAAMMLIQRYGPAAILPHLIEGNGR
jgi:hypothetical protein